MMKYPFRTSSPRRGPPRCPLSLPPYPPFATQTHSDSLTSNPATLAAPQPSPSPHILAKKIAHLIFCLFLYLRSQTVVDRQQHRRKGCQVVSKAHTRQQVGNQIYRQNKIT